MHSLIGVDPGSHSLGVAVRTPSGQLFHHTVRGEGDLQKVWRGLSFVFCEDGGDGAVVLIEDGIYGIRSRSLSILSEVRGIVMAEAYRRGWEVRKVGVQTWKSRLTKEERKMKKDRLYVAHFNQKMGWSCSTPDEVDAALILECAS